MSDINYQQFTEDGDLVTCSQCHVGTQLIEYEGRMTVGKATKDGPVKLCPFCFQTLLSEAVHYRPDNISNGEIALGMFQCFNILLEQLKK